MNDKTVVRLKDVAEAAGVDTSTASRVLNGEAGHRVAAETRNRVLAAAGRLGYRPNEMARALRTARTRTLGIVVPQLDNPVFPQIIIGATSAAHARGYELLVSLVDAAADSNSVYDRLAHANRVDGLLVSTLEDDATLRGILKRASVPFVLVNRKLRGVANFVVHDNFEAAKASAAYLLSLGHRRIAHVAGRLTGYNGSQRLAGYESALRDAGIEPSPDLVFEAGYTLEGGVRATEALLASRRMPTAILAATVISAAGALKALHAAGVRVPQDVSVMSIHDLPIADMLQPPLTAMRLPLQEMGKVATEGLIDVLEGKAKSVSRLLPHEQLVVRSSTAPPRSRTARR
ncbi:MAG: LacI family transcriptional regulator [Steroidobacteraceae bacterium]|nr:LacI family transcriptional regulator [Steroidobacteraceae bacterium]